METSNYVDIFATKGIEYLFIIGFLLVLIVFWRRLSSLTKPTSAATDLPGISPDPWFSLEKGLFYHQGHSWVRAEGNDLAVVGIDDFTQRLLGGSSAIDLPQIGSRLKQGEKGLKLWFGSKAVDILSPIEGEVVAINNEVLQNPKLLNSDPYGKGWLMSVRVPQMKRNLANLFSGDLAMAWMKETVYSLQKRMAGSLGVALQDGGIPVEGIAKVLSPDNWDEVAADFLLTRQGITAPDRQMRIERIG
jgi:glycine cleavage system H protein